MQLDVGVSPPADIIKINYHLIPNLRICGHIRHGTNRPNSQRDMIFFLVNFGIVTYRQKATLKSPPCISTGGLKNAT